MSIDEATLKKIAATTGGQYFRATDSQTLTSVYAQIDELERTKIEQRRFSDYKEMTVESVHLGGIRLPPLLSIVVVLLAVEAIAAATRFRTLP